MPWTIEDIRLKLCSNIASYFKLCDTASLSGSLGMKSRIWYKGAQNGCIDLGFNPFALQIRKSHKNPIPRDVLVGGGAIYIYIFGDSNSLDFGQYTAKICVIADALPALLLSQWPCYIYNGLYQKVFNSGARQGRSLA